MDTMTIPEIRGHITMLASRVIAKAPADQTKSLTTVYFQVNLVFEEYIMAHPKMCDLSIGDIEQHWSGFCSGFILGQLNPKLGDE